MPRPLQYPPVGSHQPVTFKRSGDDYPVGGVSVKSRQLARPDSDFAVHGNLYETFLK